MDQLPPKSFPKWPLIALFSFLLGIASVFAYQKRQPSRSVLVGPSPSSLVLPALSEVERAEDPTAGWEIYTNTKYEFNVRYPNDWLVVENPTNDPRAAENSIRLSNNMGSVYISIYSEYGGACPQEYQKIIIDDQPHDVCISETALTGEKAWKQITFQKSKNIIELRGYAKKSTPEELLIPQILSTFKFTDTNQAACQTSGDCPGGYFCDTFNQVCNQELPD